MQRKLALAAVLCLAVAAALTIGAAPTLAADGCDCHTADPPTATAAHAPLVTGVDCTTCHTDWTVPHPAASTSVALRLLGNSTDAGYRLHGRLGLMLVHPGVVVYLQQRLWGATEFTDLTQVTTGAMGGFAFTVASPAPFATYRAIAQGHVGPSIMGTLLYTPKSTTLLPTPELTLIVRGFTHAPLTPTTVKLGRTLTVSGAVAPADLGGKVAIRVRKLQRATGKWVTRITVKRTISATGTYSWKWTPKSRGDYRVSARIAATAAHRGVVTRFPPRGLNIYVY